MKHVFKNLSFLLLAFTLVTFSSCSKDDDNNDPIDNTDNTDSTYSSSMTLTVDAGNSFTLKASGDDDRGQIALWTITPYNSTINRTLRITLYDTFVGTHVYDNSDEPFRIWFTDDDGTFLIVNGTLTITSHDTTGHIIKGNIDVEVALTTDLATVKTITGSFDIEYTEIVI